MLDSFLSVDCGLASVYGSLVVVGWFSPRLTRSPFLIALLCTPSDLLMRQPTRSVMKTINKDWIGSSSSLWKLPPPSLSITFPTIFFLKIQFRLSLSSTLIRKFNYVLIGLMSSTKSRLLLTNFVSSNQIIIRIIFSIFSFFVNW